VRPSFNCFIFKKGTDMPSYQELMQQAKDLMAQAEKVRDAERQGVIDQIKATMAANGITLADLGGRGGRRAGGAKKSAEVRYRGPNGETWSGGRGRRPDWVMQLQAQGQDIEQYRV
jgi:DNA-binding protein H-NS